MTEQRTLTPEGDAAPGGDAWETLSVVTFYIIALFAVPAPMMVTAFGQVGGPATLLAILSFLWWLWHGLHRETFGIPSMQPVRNAALWFLLATLIAYAHAAAIALPVDERSPADGMLLRIVGFVGVVCIVTDGITTRRALWALVTRISVAMGAMSTLALVQVATGEIYVDRISIPGLSPVEGLNLISRGIITRPSGTATHPIEFAAVLAMGMPLVFVTSQWAERNRWVHRCFAILMPVVILLTGSRTALLCGFLAFAVMMFAWGFWTRIIAANAALAILAATFVTVPGLFGTLRGLFTGASGDPSVESRTNSYATVETFWQRHVWLGRGMGTFLPKYWILDNMYLNVLIGGGLLVTFSLLWLIARACRSAFRAARRATRPQDRQLAVAALASTLAGAVSLALFDVFSFAQAAGMLFLAISLSGAVLRCVDDSDRALESVR